VADDGLIVTNKHVVADDEAVYKVKLSDGKEYDAKVMAKDPVLDVALIKIEANNLPTLKFGDSDKLKLGQSVIAIGNALAEFGNTVTRGIVSGIGRKVEAGGSFGFTEVIEQAIQTDAAINPGNSGGPLINMAGEVVGINTAVSSEGQLVGFAIPINAAKKTIESVQKTGRIVRPWLGIRYVAVTPRLAEANKLKVNYGFLIIGDSANDELAVIPGGPADKAGLAENDIILEVDGKKMADKESLANEIGKHNVGDVVDLKILHKGEEKNVKVKLEEFSNKINK
jgi:serine protease Do